jgi:hypothetical protein
MVSRTEIVERELGVRVPEQYAAFLEKYGIFHAPGIEVFGIRDDLLDYDGIPCVIGATRKSRLREGLPHRFLVIEDIGVDGVIICLDTEDKKIYQISHVYGNHKIADSFSEWFEKDILEYSKRKRPNRYAREKFHLIYDPKDSD